MNKKGRMVNKKHRRNMKRVKERRKAQLVQATKVPAAKEPTPESRP